MKVGRKDNDGADNNRGRHEATDEDEKPPRPEPDSHVPTPLTDAAATLAGVLPFALSSMVMTADTERRVWLATAPAGGERHLLVVQRQLQKRLHLVRHGAFEAGGVAEELVPL